MSIVGCRSSRGPRSFPSEVLRVVLATLCLVAAAAVWSPASARADTAYPVLLVHGANPRPGNFDQMISWLRADGYRPYTIDLPGIDTAINAKKIGTKVEEIRAVTGAS